MTIHRALSEIKLIDAKIKRKIREIQPTAIKQGGKIVSHHIGEDEFKENAVSMYQSINDLINRKHAIKSAIVKSNSETVVIVGGKSYTVCEAINFKYIINFKKDLLNKIRADKTQTDSSISVENEKIKNQAFENAKIMLGKQDDSKVKPTDNDVKNITDPFIERHALSIVDPLDINKVIEDIQEGIEAFESEVDAVLSESNATTLIEI